MSSDHTVSLDNAPESRTIAALSLALASGTALGEVELDLSDPMQCRFGAYTLIERIGGGGMGVVYRARQESLERDVAIKLLNVHLGDDEQALARFRFEATSAAALNHPNIVQVLEIGQQQGIAFIAMQLVRGQTLADRIAGGCMIPRDAVVLLLKLCDAVGYAHRLHLLHLDMKPSNVLIDERGEPLVADFGLARRMDEKGLVEAQEVSGTPAYMAPEQVLIKQFRLNAQTDIYALGAILYEMLCGIAPNGRGAPAEVMQRALAGQIPPPRQLAPKLPRDLEAIALKCLSLRQQDRYENAEALADDLRRYANSLPVSVRRPTLRERTQRWYAREPRFAVAMLLMLALALAGGAVFAQLYHQADFERAGAEGLARLMMAQSDEDTTPILQRLQSQVKGGSAWVPLIDCHEFNVNCGRGLNPLTNIDESLPLAQRQRLVASLQAYVPRIRAWGRPRLSGQLAEKVRQIEYGLWLAPRARAAAATDTADGYVFAWLLSRGAVFEPHDRVADAVANAWFKQALARADHAWQVQALAQTCNDASPDCRLAIQRFRELDPDNAAAWWLALPTSPDPNGDAQLEHAAAVPTIDNHESEFLNAARAFAQRLMPTLDARSRVSPEQFALDAWNATGSFRFPAGYCRSSFEDRNVPAVRDACRANFTKLDHLRNPTLLDETFAASMAMHMSDDPSVQAAAWHRYRNARWIYSAWTQLPPDPEGSQMLQFFESVRTRGELGNFQSEVADAQLPLEAPEPFVTRKPLPWVRMEPRTSVDRH